MKRLEAFCAKINNDGVHIPLAKALPGLRAYRVGRGLATGTGEPSPYHLVAELSFDSMTDLQNALETEEGKATNNDLANFAGAGADLFIFESKEV